MINEFYKSVLPPMGVRVLAVFKNGLKSPPSHDFHETNEDLLEAASTFDGLGKNVYHACASYLAPTNRKAENVQAVKAVWADLDCGPNKPYSGKTEAFKHFEQFRVALGLPESHVVSSGNGLHHYFAFTKSISPDNWDRVSAAFAVCMDHFGVKHDTSRTQDKASILRVPGTGNYKTTPAKPVELKRMGQEVPAGDFYKKLKTYAEANGLILDGPVKGKPLVENKMMVKSGDFPPSVAGNIIQHCDVLKHMDDTGGDASFEIWRGAMGIAKHCTEPTVMGPHWTRNRIATGHDKDDWQHEMDTWNTGPTTCAEFSKHSPKCASCKQFGKVTSPITLGYPAQPVVASTQAIALHQPAAMPGKWEFGADWVRDLRATSTRTGHTHDGKMTRSEKQKDGTYEHIPFCDRYWQVMRRIRTIDSVWRLEIGYEEYRGKPHKTFLLDSAAVTQPDVIRREFSAREIHIYGGALGMDRAQALMRFDQEINRAHEMETPTFPCMGWVTKNNDPAGELTGEFIVGDDIYRPKDIPQKILLEETVTSTIKGGFTTKGTTAEWVQLVNYIYNRKGATPYQFVITAMLGAPLVKLMPGGGEWHGIPLVLSGDSGAAKTTTALVAMSIYATPQSLKFSAQASQGDTIPALAVKMGSLRNLPFVMDEMTNADADKISNIAYMTSNGKAKDAARPDGSLRHSNHRWATMSIITSNDSLHDTLHGAKNANTAEAGEIRLFEAPLTRNAIDTVFKDVHRNTIEMELLGNQWGCVGRDWIQFLVNNRGAVQELLAREREKYMINPSDSSEIRFYKDVIITTKVAGMLAQRKGFINWNITELVNWAEGTLLTLREDAVNKKSWPAKISDFVASLHGRTITTRHLRTTPGRRSKNTEVPLEPLSSNAVPVARKALDDRRFVFTANALRDWCSQHKVSYKTMLDQMLQLGYLVGVEIGKKMEPRMINIGSGTSIARPQAPCFEFDYSAVTEVDADSEASGDNVVAMPVPGPVTDSVTVANLPEGDTAVSP